MRGRSVVATALPLAAVVLAFSAAPALAQPVTTPVPTPTDPNSPPMSAPVGPTPTAHAVGDSGTGLGIIRLLPNSAPTKTIVPGAEDKLPKQAAAEFGFGLASAQANSEAYLAFERSVAEAAPGGLALQGSSPQAPGALAQTAPPNNPQPTHSGLSLPSTPLDSLITASALSGQVHAQWDDALGPCVDTISDASTEVGSLSLVNAIPTLPNVTDLSGVFDASKLTARQDAAVVNGLKQLSGPLSTLGGVLSGGASPKADGTGALLSLPNTLSARSTVRLVDIPGSKNKAVQSTSTLQVAKIQLLAGTPFAMEIRVVSQPTLRVTSTGDEKTSSVKYTAPVLEVWQGGKRLGGLDAAHPSLDIPIGIPLPGVPGTEKLPIIGALLANGQQVTDAVSKGLQKLDLGVLRLGVAQLDERGMGMTDPFKGYQLGATARMLDLQVLPTAALGLPNLPSALAQVSLGEQVARAYAPTGGVVCLPSDQPVPPPTPRPQGMTPPGLAYTTLAYRTIPMFWTGTAMLLVGVVLVAAVPTLRNPRGYALANGLPPGPPRDEPDPPADKAPPAEPEAEPAGTDAAEAESDAIDPSGGDPAGASAAEAVTEGAPQAEAEPRAEAVAQVTEAGPSAVATEAGPKVEAGLTETVEEAGGLETEAPADEAGDVEATDSPKVVPVARVTPSEAARRRRRLRKAQQARKPRRR
ncbi:hypothetical protein [Actinophytocola sp.]|uniref:hypothetical protein n=1 Tax=Actinophytocola sp. TaxID=1872138 RepID=UPI0025BF7D7D|nr:hypothetical protein [Actinophytocola sp.]